MLVYVNGIEKEASALAGVKLGAWAVGVDFGDAENALAAENIRDWYFDFDRRPLRTGCFSPTASYYKVEELASFCGLDAIHLIYGADLPSFAKYSGRIFYELTLEQLALAVVADLPNLQQIPDFLVIRLESSLDIADKKFAALLKKVYANPKCQHSLFLAGDFPACDWQMILANDFEVAGIVVASPKFDLQLAKLCKEIALHQL